MTLKWWQKAVFYQIYPRSFADSNADGIGDLQGIINKLDYLQQLGIDAIWLSPHYPSPNWDCGYDIADYCAVAPEYGTLDDFRAFLHQAHARDIKVILDFVANHTSDQHPWFLESKSSRDNPKADWYVWVDTPPNNWQSCFDGDAWTYIPERGQYYYHYFMQQQPDLNWHNPEVVNAMWAAVRFWLDLGVDGFRLDAISTIYEDPNLTPHTLPFNLAGLHKKMAEARTQEEKEQVHKAFDEMFKYQRDQPELHPLMKQLRAILDEYPGDRMLVGEEDNPAYMGNGDDELQMVFNFPLMRVPKELTPTYIRANQTERLTAISAISADAWPCNTLGNHDSSRVYTRYGDGLHDAERARLSLALLLTLKGTPFLYNGEEIGMTDYHIGDPSLLRDTMATWAYQSMLREHSLDPQEAARLAGQFSRDKNRTPMQWANTSNAGFSPNHVQTWLPVNPNFANGINVQDQASDPVSMLNFYQRLLRLRRNTPALMEGDYEDIAPTAENYLAFTRSTPGQKVLVVLSFSAERLRLTLELAGTGSLHTLFSSAGRSRPEESPADLHLGAYEIYIAQLG